MSQEPTGMKLTSVAEKNTQTSRRKLVLEATRPEEREAADSQVPSTSMIALNFFAGQSNEKAFNLHDGTRDNKTLNIEGRIKSIKVIQAQTGFVLNIGDTISPTIDNHTQTETADFPKKDVKIRSETQSSSGRAAKEPLPPKRVPSNTMKVTKLPKVTVTSINKAVRMYAEKKPQPPTQTNTAEKNKKKTAVAVLVPVKAVNKATQSKKIVLSPSKKKQLKNIVLSKSKIKVKPVLRKKKVPKTKVICVDTPPDQSPERLDSPITLSSGDSGPE